MLARTPQKNSRWKQPLVFALTAVWLTAVIGGTCVMLAYATAPGRTSSSPVTWPDTSHLSQNSTLPTLLMFVHPHCPCSRASIGELALLMAHCQGSVNAQVVFLRPEGMTEEWVRTDSWNAAAKIPGVTL